MMSSTGAITGYVDVAQIMVYLFWAFFAGLILYLRREDKREGYPLESERSGDIRVEGFPKVPSAKVFELSDGSRFEAPHDESDERPLHAVPPAVRPPAAALQGARVVSDAGGGHV